MDERIDIVNNQGIPTGKTCLKSFAHQHGILHASVHIWLYTDDQKILIQKREEGKDTFPGLWDISVAGHIGAGELPIVSAIREVQEEIGLNITAQELNYMGIWEEKHQHSNGITDHEIHHIYIGKLNQAIHSLTPQKEEVAAIKLIPISELETNCNNPLVFVPHKKDYYEYIINTLKLL